MKYTEEELFSLPHTERFRQAVDYSGMIFFKGSTPTDVDGFLEKNNKMFIFYEYKLRGTPMPEGQEIAYTHLCDALRAAGKQAVLFLCEHKDYDPQINVCGKDAVVTKYYSNGKWFSGVGKTAKEMTDAYIDWCKGCEAWT